MSGVRVSDHALLRALERICGLPVERLRADLESALGRVSQAAEAIGGGNYLILSDGHVFVVRDGKATTVLDRTNEHARFIALADNGRPGFK